MDINVKTKWVEALRSGEYTQTSGQLYVSPEESTVSYPTGYCCLAVLGVVMGHKIKDDDSTVFAEDYENREHRDYSYPTLHSYLSKEQVSECVVLNDDEGKSFSEIADYIEQHF